MSALRAALENKGVRWIAVGWTFFIAENLILSENREYIIAIYDEKRYHQLYNVLSTSACAGILYAYISTRGTLPLLPPPGPIRKLLSFSFQTTGLVGLSQLFPRLRSPFAPVEKVTVLGPSAASPELKFQCPMDFKPLDVPPGGVYGMDRVSRHSFTWSASFVGLGLALNAAFAPQVAMFGMPVVFAYIGSWHKDQRYLRGSGGWLSRETYESTSNVPFVALFQGKQSWKDLYVETKISNAGIAALASSAMFILRKSTR